MPNEEEELFLLTSDPADAMFPYLIREVRRDGGKWTYHYRVLRDAQADLPALRNAHQGRTYTPVGFTE